MGRVIRYEAHIVGDEAPFKWEVKMVSRSMSTSAHVNGCKGESDSYEDAMFDAAACAHAAERRRRHGATKGVEPLFEVDLDALHDEEEEYDPYS